ncbi:MAG TPA: DUF1015 domain-containing protein [Terriglobales bacterium]|nr:DUF1015 domain-containing protein [Terriglobales bacterium]
MAEIAPFRAARYDPGRVELAQVVTQPYDKITPEMQERYYGASPYNLVRIILGKADKGDGPGENVYTRAAGFFHAWRQDGVLRQDEQLSIYSYVQNFVRPGGKEELERRGFIALGRIEDYASGVVFRHEQTLAKPKADRLELLRATRAHFGQLFMLYSDPNGTIDSLLRNTSEAELEIRDEYDVRHRLWKISDPALIEQVRAAMSDKKLIIADGHHRYETALNYRNERGASPRHSVSSPAPYDLVMMTFINMDSPGLVILPTHRVVHGLDSFSPDSFRDQARRYFSVDEVDSSINAGRATAILREAGHSGTALLAVTADRAFLIDTPRGNTSEFFAGVSLRQQALDVVQLHKCLLEGVLGISPDAIREQRNISYVRDAAEAMMRVRSGNANIAFLMNPVRIRQVRDIAFAGEVLPQKSTDFYPKLLSGVTIYALE